jgi:hypothetical protein
MCLKIATSVSLDPESITESEALHIARDCDTPEPFGFIKYFLPLDSFGVIKDSLRLLRKLWSIRFAGSGRA